MGILTTLLSNKAHLSGYTILIVMLLTAYFTANTSINELSLEVGELRAEVRYQAKVIDTLTLEIGKRVEAQH